jgi:hypothetical protein
VEDHLCGRRGTETAAAEILGHSTTVEQITHRKVVLLDCGDRRCVFETQMGATGTSSFLSTPN